MAQINSFLNQVVFLRLLLAIVRLPTLVFRAAWPHFLSIVDLVPILALDFLRHKLVCLLLGHMLQELVDRVCSKVLPQGHFLLLFFVRVAGRCRLVFHFALTSLLLLLLQVLLLLLLG